MRQPQIKQYNGTDWPMKAAGLISNEINDVLSEQAKCSLMLTGDEAQRGFIRLGVIFLPFSR